MMIEMKQIVKEFALGGETITAVDRADLQIERGEFVAITGPSGSGKSTLMNIIGLLDNADSGTYLLDGTDVTSLSDDEQSMTRNQKIGFVFQSFYLLQKLTALENVMIPLLYRGINEKEARDRAMTMLRKLKLEDRYTHLPNQLSGGQQQRVAIARALAGEPALILADEPTGALDQTTGREILHLLQELNEAGQTIIMITHDESLARMTKRIVHIEDGKLEGGVLEGDDVEPDATAAEAAVADDDAEPDETADETAVADDDAEPDETAAETDEKAADEDATPEEDSDEPETDN